MTTTPAALADLLQQRSDAMTTMLSETAWKPSRSHIEVCRNLMRDAAEALSRPSDAAAVREADSQAMRDAIDAGLRDFCSETDDFDMSPGMRRAATDFIMAHPGMFAAAIRQGGLQGEGL